MIPESTTCPAARRTSNRRRALRRTWGGKEWKIARKEFLKEHPTCRFHAEHGLKIPATTPHHPHMESTQAGYPDLSRCIPLCARCHTALHHGLNLCPECHLHYKRWDQEICRRCFDKAHPEVVAAREAAKQRWKRIQKEKRKAARDKAKARKAGGERQ